MDRRFLGMAGTMALLSALTWAVATRAATGPFNTTHSTHEYAKMDKTSNKIDVVQPVPTRDGQVFPLVVFNHGFEVGVTRHCAARRRGDPGHPAH